MLPDSPRRSETNTGASTKIASVVRRKTKRPSMEEITGAMTPTGGVQTESAADAKDGATLAAEAKLDSVVAKKDGAARRDTRRGVSTDRLSIRLAPDL